MIPYEELDKALARWKARAQNAGRDFEESGAIPTSGPSNLPPPPDRTGEIDIGDSESIVVTYEEN
jgi:hypothetical protein